MCNFFSIICYLQKLIFLIFVENIPTIFYNVLMEIAKIARFAYCRWRKKSFDNVCWSAVFLLPLARARAAKNVSYVNNFRTDFRSVTRAFTQ